MTVHLISQKFLFIIHPILSAKYTIKEIPKHKLHFNSFENILTLYKNMNTLE